MKKLLYRLREAELISDIRRARRDPKDWDDIIIYSFLLALVVVAAVLLLGLAVTGVVQLVIASIHNPIVALIALGVVTPIVGIFLLIRWLSNPLEEQKKPDPADEEVMKQYEKIRSQLQPQRKLFRRKKTKTSVV